MLPQKWVSREKMRNVRKCIYQLAVQDGIRLDFHQNFGGDQSCDLDHGCRWADFSEHCSMSAADFFPLGDIHYKNARAHYIFQAGSGFLQSGLNVFESLNCLRSHVADTD